MLAKLWAKKIMAGEKTLKDVPTSLVAAVKKELAEMLK